MIVDDGLTKCLLSLRGNIHAYKVLIERIQLEANTVLVKSSRTKEEVECRWLQGRSQALFDLAILMEDIQNIYEKAEKEEVKTLGAYT